MAHTLGIATACMFTLPIATFYAARHIFRHQAQPENCAGIAAIVVVNLVIAGYCVRAFREDRDERNEQNDNNTHDATGPRVGIFKQRTD